MSISNAQTSKAAHSANPHIAPLQHLKPPKPILTLNTKCVSLAVHLFYTRYTSCIYSNINLPHPPVESSAPSKTLLNNLSKSLSSCQGLLTVSCHFFHICKDSVNLWTSKLFVRGRYLNNSDHCLIGWASSLLSTSLLNLFLPFLFHTTSISGFHRFWWEEQFCITVCVLISEIVYWDNSSDKMATYHTNKYIFVCFLSFTERE